MKEKKTQIVLRLLEKNWKSECLQQQRHVGNWFKKRSSRLLFARLKEADFHLQAVHGPCRFLRGFQMSLIGK